MTDCVWRGDVWMLREGARLGLCLGKKAPLDWLVPVGEGDSTFFRGLPPVLSVSQDFTSEKSEKFSKKFFRGFIGKKSNRPS